MGKVYTGRGSWGKPSNEEVAIVKFQVGVIIVLLINS
jgi:hypothetical protein